jgi:leucyl-tRNA synthetase
MKEWLPVDMYVGGIEHAVLHLLYARFYTKFLYDIGVVDFQEPFKRLFNQGMITKDGAKMSKSKGNVVSPDELVERYGADSLRMYELFVGPPELDSEWDDRGIDGVYRFINKVWKLIVDNKDSYVEATKEMERARHQLIYEITTRMNDFHFNTVVSGFMEYTNKLSEIARTSKGLDKDTIDTLIILLAPFIPHTAEELWELTGHNDSVFKQEWPVYDKEKMKEDTVEIVIQINGKVRDKIEVNVGEAKETVIEKSKDAVKDKIEGKNIIKEIYVPGKIVNLVVK